jgi:hypothetical protein
MKSSKLVSVVSMGLLAIAGVMHVNTGWAKSVEEKVKDWIDDFSDTLKKKTDELGEDFQAIQNYLDNYHWKGVIEEKARSGPATLKHLKLNEHSKAILAMPGETIEAVVECKLDSEQTSVFGLYRIVIGIKEDGPQAVIGNESGLFAGKSTEKFTLKAPEKAGIYQIRFRTVDTFFKAKALDAWIDEEGNEPDGTTTIGVIIVKP